MNIKKQTWCSVSVVVVVVIACNYSLDYNN